MLGNNFLIIYNVIQYKLCTTLPGSSLPSATVENRKTRITTNRFREQVGNRQREAGQILVGAAHSLRTCVSFFRWKQHLWPEPSVFNHGWISHLDSAHGVRAMRRQQRFSVADRRDWRRSTKIDRRNGWFTVVSVSHGRMYLSGRNI